MEYRTLGKTGLKVSRMGFGGIPIQKIDEEGTRKLLRKWQKKESIILILPEAIQSVNNISGMDWRESGINLYWQQNPCPEQRMLWQQTLKPVLKTSVQITLTFIRFIIQVWNSWIR